MENKLLRCLVEAQPVCPPHQPPSLIWELQLVMVERNSQTRPLQVSFYFSLTESLIGRFSQPVVKSKLECDKKTVREGGGYE